MAGYIKLYRGWRENPAFTTDEPLSDQEAWLWLIENCAWKKISRRNAKGETIEIDRGQILTSVRSLAATFKWSKDRVSLFTKRLQRRSMLTLEPVQSGTVITITNYCKYQGEEDGQQDSQKDGRRTVEGQSKDTQEERKERKERKEDSSSLRSEDAREKNSDLFGEKIPEKKSSKEKIFMTEDFQPVLLPTHQAMVKRWPDHEYETLVDEWKWHWMNTEEKKDWIGWQQVFRARVAAKHRWLEEKGYLKAAPLTSEDIQRRREQEAAYLRQCQQEFRAAVLAGKREWHPMDIPAGVSWPAGGPSAPWHWTGPCDEGVIRDPKPEFKETVVPIRRGNPHGTLDEQKEAFRDFLARQDEERKRRERR